MALLMLAWVGLPARRTGGDRIETITVSRGATNNRAVRETLETFTIQGLFAWGDNFSLVKNGMEMADLGAHLYVCKGTNLKARDRIARGNGESYAVVGHALWAESNPLVDDAYEDDDNLIVFQLVSTNG